jgi:hypothetical protein
MNARNAIATWKKFSASAMPRKQFARIAAARWSVSSPRLPSSSKARAGM